MSPRMLEILVLETVKVWGEASVAGLLTYFELWRVNSVEVSDMIHTLINDGKLRITDDSTLVLP